MTQRLMKPVRVAPALNPVPQEPLRRTPGVSGSGRGQIPLQPVNDVREFHMNVAVLVHGGFHGGWCWDKVRAILEKEKWDVYTPSLTGLGDRSHLGSPDTSLQTHIDDIVHLLESEDLHNVVLCAHSAAGFVASAVADTIPDRIHALVYLDAFVPNDGQSLFDMIGQDHPTTIGFRRMAVERGDGWLVPADYFTAEDFGVTDPGDVRWLERNLTAHPIRAFADRVSLTGTFTRVPNKVYVRCAEAKNSAQFDEKLRELRAEPGWTVYSWPCTHDVMITDPYRVREVLVALTEKHPE